MARTFCINNEGDCFGDDLLNENDLTEDQADLLQAWMTCNVDMSIWSTVRLWATIEDDGSHLWLCTEYITLKKDDDEANKQMDRLANTLFPNLTHRNFPIASGLGTIDESGFPCIFVHEDGTPQRRMIQYSLDIDVLGLTPEEVTEASQKLYKLVKTDEWSKAHSVTVC